jgi:hypothetical protein
VKQVSNLKNMYVIYSMVRRRVRVKRNRNATTSKRNSKGASKRNSKGSKASLKQSGGWWGNSVQYVDIDYSKLYAYGLVNDIVYTDDIFDNRFILNELYYDWYTIEVINEIMLQYALWELANPTITYNPDPVIYWLNGYTEYIVSIDEKNNNTGKPNPSVNMTVEVVKNLIKFIEDNKSQNNTFDIINSVYISTLVKQYITEFVEKKSIDKLQNIIEEMTNKLNKVCNSMNNADDKCKLYLSGFEQVKNTINKIMDDNALHNTNTQQSIVKFGNTLNQINTQRAKQVTRGGKYY